MKFQCSKCGQIFEGQQEKCPSCGISMTYQKNDNAFKSNENPNDNLLKQKQTIGKEFNRNTLSIASNIIAISFIVIFMVSGLILGIVGTTIFAKISIYSNETIIMWKDVAMQWKGLSIVLFLFILDILFGLIGITIYMILMFVNILTNKDKIVTLWEIQDKIKQNEKNLTN